MPKPGPHFALIALIPLVVVCGSCQLPGMLSGNFLPVDKIEAVYKPIDQKTLIFVDDRRNAIPSAHLRGVVSEQAARELSEKEVITRFVPASGVEDLRASQPDFDSWPIDRIGKQLGASQIIYILIDGFDPGGVSAEVPRPIATARIKVVDVTAGRLFPIQGEHGVTSRLTFKHPPIDADSHGRQAMIAQKLATRLGQDIAQQFYKHAPRAVGSGFDD